MTKNQGVIQGKQRLQRQIMRRITPVIVLTFGLLTVMVVLLVLNTTRQTVEESQLDFLTSQINTLNDPFEEATNEAASLANAASVRRFTVISAQYAPDDNTAIPLIAARREMLQTFNTLVETHSERYLAVRYLTLDGFTVGEVINNDGISQISETFRQTDALESAAFQSAVSGMIPPNQPFWGEIIPRSETGVARASVYVPLTNETSVSLQGVLELEMAVGPIFRQLTVRTSDPDLSTEDRRYLVVDNRNQVLADNLQTMIGELDETLADLLVESNGSFRAEYVGSVVASSLVAIDAPGITLPLRLVVVDNVLEVQTIGVNQALIVIVIGILGAALVVLLIERLLRTLLRPLDTVVPVAASLHGEQITDMDAFSPTYSIATQRGDEIGTIAQALASANSRINALQTELTQQARRRQRDIEVAASIGRRIATFTDIDLLLQEAIDLICKDMGFYHAQIFLIDDAHYYAVLVKSRGEAGDKLLAQGHKLQVGSRTVIGTVTGEARPVIVNDTTAGDVPHKFNALLPETRAELGLPLMVGGEVFGALDIQSHDPQAFLEEDLPVYQLLADQIALAISKARLLQDSNEYVDQIRQDNARRVREAWEHAAAEGIGQRAYRYDLRRIEQIRDDSPNGSNGAGEVELPIKIRDEVVGVLSASTEPGQVFTEGDQVILSAVANRIALAIENARLFQETQLSLSETSMLYQLSRFLNEATTLEDVLQAIILSVMPDAEGGQIWIFDDYMSGDLPRWMEIKADLAFGERDEANTDLRGLRLHMPDHAFLRSLSSNQVTLINDARRDSRLDNGLQIVFRRMHGRAIVFIPLNVRGEWPGLLTVEFDEAREFTEREGRLYAALIDQAGIAIDNRLLLQQTEEAVTLNENLYAASRLINTARSPKDLVYAAVATTDSELEFSLGQLEGALDANGWPTVCRIIAYSESGAADDSDIPGEFRIAPESPMLHREPEIVRDGILGQGKQASYIEWLHNSGNRFTAIFPLYSANQPIALFFITSPDPGVLRADDYDIYRALTGQMSTQLENRRLLERTAAALDETRRLYVASRAINAAADSAGVYSAMSAHLSQALNIETQTLRIALLLAQPFNRYDAPQIAVAHAWTNRESNTDSPLTTGQVFALEEAPFGPMTAEVEEVVYLSDTGIIQGYTGESEVLALLKTSGARSALIAPVQSRQDWFGVLLVHSDQPAAFGEQYTRFLEAVAGQVALAVENQQLFAEAQREAQRAQMEAQRALALAEAAQLANQVGADFEKNIEAVLQQVAEAAGYDRWQLAVLNEERERLEVISSNLPDGNQTPSSFDLDEEHPLVMALQLERRLLINDPSAFPYFQTQTHTGKLRLRTMLGKVIAVPIKLGDRPGGALLIGRGLQTEDLDEGDERIVGTLAAQIAVAMENRRLFQQVQQEQRTLESILSTLPAGVLVLEPETMRPLNWNEQAVTYLGDAVLNGEPFNPEAYRLYRTGTNLLYRPEELPIVTAQTVGGRTFVDDVAVMDYSGSYSHNLLINAAPIRRSDGSITAIVATFTDISNLRSMENTLQETLRETIAIYEAQRQISEADRVEDVLDVLIVQLAMLQPRDAYVMMIDEQTGELAQSRYLLDPFMDMDLARSLFRDTEVFMQHPQHNSLSAEIKAKLAEYGIGSLVSMPLFSRVRDSVIGWMLLYHGNTFAFSDEQERTVSQLGDITATAIDNRMLIQSTQAALKETETLYTINSAISRAKDYEGLIEALERALTALQAESFSVFVASDLLRQNQLVESTDDQIPLLRAALSRREMPEGGLYITDLNEVTDSDAFTNDLKAAAGGAIRGLAAVNLRVKDGENGRVVVAYTRPHYFTDSEMRLLNTIAGSTSVVLDNLVLVEEIQSTLEETTILYQAGRALTDVSTPDEVLDVVTDFLINNSVDQVFITLLHSRSWDAPDAWAEIVASWSKDGSVDLEGITFSPAQFPAWKQLSAASLVAISDAYTDPNISDEERGSIESLGARSLVVVPLRVPKREIGAVWISARESYRQTDRELRTYQAFGEQASLSLEASYLLQQMERRARQLQTSSEVSTRTGSILDMEVLLPQLVDLIRDAFNYDHVQIFLMDEIDDFALLRASTGDAGRQLLRLGHKLRKGSQSVIGQVTERGEPVIALDTASATVVHMPNPVLPLTRSEMALPLIIKGKVIGALDVQSNQPNAFSEDDVVALRTLAAQISIAIDNARLYEDSRQQADKMSFLFDIITTAAAAETLIDALGRVTEEIRRTRSALSATIYLQRTYIDRSQNVFEVLEAVAASGVDGPLSGIEQVRLDQSFHPIAMAGMQKKPMIVADVEKQPDYLPIAIGARASIIVPMLVGGELLGVIVLETTRPNSYDFEDIQLMLTLSGSLSAIVQSAQLLEQLQNANEELRELDRLKSEFLANMSHELRTPLNSIIGFSRVMLKGIDGPLTEMQEQDLTTIFNSGQHLLTLINEILDQAKIAAGKMDLKFAYFDMKAVVDSVKSIAIGLLKDKPINLHVEIAPTLPQVYGDEFRTRQVLLNLVSNASKFTNQGSVTIRAYPTQENGRTYVQVDVIDTGIGISEKDIPVLFETFQQVDSSLTRVQGGTGLGLPIAKSLVEMQGGRMLVESAVNVGSTFSVTIPTEPVMPEDDDEETFEEGEHDEQHDTRPTLDTRMVPRIEMPHRIMQIKRQILLIEDDPNMVDQFRRVLQRDGFEVLAATIQLEAEAMASGLRPTLIVMDVNFGRGAGWNILNNLKSREDTADIPVVIVTMSDEQERICEAGAFRYIQRPFTPDTLLNAALEAEKESNTERILIIDDQPDHVRLLSQLLDEHGSYRVFAATSGEEGISMVARRQPHLIILDLRMPEMDGFAVLNELRSNPETSAIPVMIVTGDLDLASDERSQLKNIRILPKTDISEEAFEQFLSGVREELAGN